MYPVLYFSSEIDEPLSENIGRIPMFNIEAGEIRGDTGVPGLRLDFNAGLRLQVPEGNWHIRITDGDTDFIFFDQDVSKKTLVSLETYFVCWQIEAYLDGKCVFSHGFDAYGQKICFQIMGSVLGDAILFFPYILAFRKKWQCQVLCKAQSMFHPLLKEYYPEFQICDDAPEDTYATYYMGAFQQPPFLIPDNSRVLPPEYIGMFLLGLTEKPAVRLLKALRPCEIDGSYVCIAVQASGARKCWLYPDGWNLVVQYLRKKGYRVLCIDAARERRSDGFVIDIPDGAEDFTGKLPLIERIQLLYHAACFVGLASGLSWLAHSTGCPVVLISGITMPYTEFATPYRVQNRFVCHGCYNDLRVDWRDNPCPYHHGTEREYECSKKISPVQVIRVLERALQNGKSIRVR